MKADKSLMGTGCPPVEMEGQELENDQPLEDIDEDAFGNSLGSNTAIWIFIVNL